jgi:hypothetical protein
MYNSAVDKEYTSDPKHLPWESSFCAFAGGLECRLRAIVRSPDSGRKIPTTLGVRSVSSSRSDPPSGDSIRRSTFACVFPVHARLGVGCDQWSPTIAQQLGWSRAGDHPMQSTAIKLYTSIFRGLFSLSQLGTLHVCPKIRVICLGLDCLELTPSACDGPTLQMRR